MMPLATLAMAANVCLRTAGHLSRRILDLTRRQWPARTVFSNELPQDGPPVRGSARTSPPLAA